MEESVKGYCIEIGVFFRVLFFLGIDRGKVDFIRR